MMVQMMMKLTLSKFSPSVRSGSLSSSSPRPPPTQEEEEEDQEESFVFHSFIRASLRSTPPHHVTYATCVCVCTDCVLTMLLLLV